MKKTVIKIIAVIIIATFIAGTAAGCRRAPESLYVPPEFIYLAEIVSFPRLKENEYLNNAVITKDNVILSVSSWEYSYDEYTYIGYDKSMPVLYRMNLDGTGLTQLTGYSPPAVAPEGCTSENVWINQLQIDNDGNIWIHETWYYAGFDMPDNVSSDMRWEYYTEMGSGSVIRVLNSTGTEINRIDVGTFGENTESFSLNSFCFDNSGNIVISTYDYMKENPSSVYVLNNNSEVLFKIDSDNYIDRLVRTADGTVGYISYEEIEPTTYSNVFRKLDITAKRVADEKYILPYNMWNVMTGSGEYDLLYNDNNNLYAYKFGEEEPIRLINWLESDILDNGIQNITMVSEDLIYCINSTWDNVTGDSGRELLRLNRVPYADIPQKTVITLASFYSWHLRDSVIKFNRTNNDYRIYLMDYSEYNTDGDWNAGLTKLATELIAGRIPDILDLSYIEYKEYTSRGLLADLYPFIDSDESMSRDDFVQGAFKAAETDGKLFQIFHSFSINTIVGNPAILGDYPGWTMEEFMQVLEANPQADIPLGQWLTKENFLQAAISYGIDNYINWAEGRVYFDNPDFIQLLEFAKTFPDEPDYENWTEDDWMEYHNKYVSDEEAIATNRQIMKQYSLSSFWDYPWTKALFGGELVFKGFPNENRNGNSITTNGGIAILERSPNKDAAWSFIRTILDDDWQMGNTWGFPTNQATFDRRVQEILDMDYGYGKDDPVPPIWRDGYDIDYDIDIGIGIDPPIYYPREQNVTQEDIDRIMDLINSASGTAGWSFDETIWNIIKENAMDFFNGSSSAQTAANVIQSRVQILVSERS